MERKDRIEGAIYGAVLGDAMGVPVEFRSRKELDADPVVSFRSNGTHGQPKYAWSDDSSLMLAQMDSLAKKKKVCYADQAKRFLHWRDRATYTSHRRVFDIGNATAVSLERLRHLRDPTRAGSTDKRCSGNGALMRILPLCIWLAEKEPDLGKALLAVEKCSSMTHRSTISIRCCQFYSMVIRGILTGGCVGFGMTLARETMVWSGLHSDLFAETRLWNPKFFELTRDDIKSDGYVVNTLEAALWCCRHAKGVIPGILQAVNLGSDTDTTGCVTGGLCGLSRGWQDIPHQHYTAVNKFPLLFDLVNDFLSAIEG